MTRRRKHSATDNGSVLAPELPESRLDDIDAALAAPALPRCRKCGAPFLAGRTCYASGVCELEGVAPIEAAVAPALLKLDLGCGIRKREDFLGVDQIAFPGVDVVCDLGGVWPWPDNSVAEIHASHMIEHFGAMKRIHIVNEMYRVTVPGGKVTIIVPHWAASRAYGDPTHEWPPVSEFWFYYLLKSWRDVNAPHTDAANLAGGFNCDWDAVWGYALHPAVALKNQEAQQFCLQFYKESAQDTIATLTCRK